MARGMEFVCADLSIQNGHKTRWRWRDKHLLSLIFHTFLSWKLIDLSDLGSPSLCCPDAQCKSQHPHSPGFQKQGWLLAVTFEWLFYWHQLWGNNFDHLPIFNIHPVRLMIFGFGFWEQFQNESSNVQTPQKITQTGSLTKASLFH